MVSSAIVEVQASSAGAFAESDAEIGESLDFNGVPPVKVATAPCSLTQQTVEGQPKPPCMGSSPGAIGIRESESTDTKVRVLRKDCVGKPEWPAPISESRREQARLLDRHYVPLAHRCLVVCDIEIFGFGRSGSHQDFLSFCNQRNF